MSRLETNIEAWNTFFTGSIWRDIKSILKDTELHVMMELADTEQCSHEVDLVNKGRLEQLRIFLTLPGVVEAMLQQQTEEVQDERRDDSQRKRDS